MSTKHEKKKKGGRPPVPVRSASSSTLLNQHSDLTLPSTSGTRPNMTTSTAAPTSPTPEVDWKLECDLVYGEYLQALMIQQLTKETINRHKTNINDQLSIQADVLAKQMAKKCELEEEIEKLELMPKLKEAFEALHALLDDAEKNTGGDKMEAGIDGLMKIVESACDSLYLNQVKPLESPEDHEEFEKLLDRCLKSLQKVSMICKDADSVRKLADCLSKFERLCGEFVEVQSSVANLEEQVQTSVLNDLSEKLVAYRGYD